MDGDHSETPVERAFARWESENRIQKLLYTEYSELEDIVLVESPFAQTTKDGVGIRQIQMGLTSTKLILASDVAATAPWNRPVDTTLELLMVCPVQCVRMSTDDSGSRYTLKAHFCHDKVLYFELASPLKRDTYWNQWCERISRLFAKKSCSSCCRWRHRRGAQAVQVPPAEVPSTNTPPTTVGCPSQTLNRGRWTDRYLFLGSKFEEVDPLESKPSELRVGTSLECFPLPSPPSSLSGTSAQSVPAEPAGGKMYLRGFQHLSRFGSGISEKCSLGLFLPVYSRTQIHKSDGDLTAGGQGRRSVGGGPNGGETVAQ